MLQARFPTIGLEQIFDAQVHSLVLDQHESRVFIFDELTLPSSP